MRAALLAHVLPALCALALAAPAAAQEDSEPPPRAPAGTDITELVAIPGGEFTMGAEDSEEMPPHKVRVDDFLIDRTEVTNAQYEAFCEATERTLPVFWGLDRFHSGPDFPDHAVVGVSQADAQAYAEWVGKRLPTEAEWEYAARGGLEGMKYDTGDELDPSRANYNKSGNDGPVAVGGYEPNGYGLYDTVGNVREWTADRWAVWEGDPAVVEVNPTGAADGRWRVIRGGGWYSGPGCQAVTVRNVLPRHWKDLNVGFRCAADSPAE